jgi:hypothetical protein
MLLTKDKYSTEWKGNLLSDGTEKPILFVRDIES